MKLMICSLGFLLFTLSGCGLDKKIGEMNLYVEIFGVFKAPPGAEGNVAPSSIDLLMTDIVLYSADDNEDMILLEEGGASYDVIDRPQIVFSKNIKGDKDRRFSSATFTLDPEIGIRGKYQSDFIELTEPTITLAEPIVFAPGKNLRLIIEIYWHKTVLRDDEAGTEEFFQPQFVALQRQ